MDSPCCTRTTLLPCEASERNASARERERRTPTNFRCDGGSTFGGPSGVVVGGGTCPRLGENRSFCAIVFTEALMASGVSTEESSPGSGRGGEAFGASPDGMGSGRRQVETIFPQSARMTTTNAACRRVRMRMHVPPQLRRVSSLHDPTHFKSDSQWVRFRHSGLLQGEQDR